MAKIQLNAHTIFVFLCFVVAVVSRSTLFPDIPGGMNQDEAMSGYEAYALSLYGTDRFGTWLPAFFEGWGWTQLSVAQSYMSIPFIWLFGFSSFTARLPMLLVSLAGIYAIYAFTRNAFGKQVAIWILFFATISPWHFQQSRWGLDCNPFPHFLMIAIFLLHKGLTQRKAYVYVSMLFFGFAMYGYGISFFTVPPFLMLLSIWLLKKRMLTFREVFCAMLIYLVIALPILCVIVVNFFHIDGGIQTPLFTAQHFPGNGRRGDLLPYTDKNTWLWFKDSALRLYWLMILSWEDGSMNTVPRFGAIYPFSPPILILGLAYLCLFTRKEKQTNSASTKENNSIQVASHIGKVLSLSWLLLALYAGLMQQRPNINNTNIIHYPIIIALGMGVYFFWKKARPMGYLVVLAYICGFALFLNDYFTVHGEQMGRDHDIGLSEALQAANASDADIIYSPVWEILTLFYLKIDPLYFQGKMTIVDKNGKEWLQYGERYRGYSYEHLNDLDRDGKSIAIVLHNDRFHHFDTDLYDVWNGKGFSALLPRKDY